MRKKAIIFDLDNTIYPVTSIGDKLFESLLKLIAESGEYTGEFAQIKDEIMRRPFQFIADDFEFSLELKTAGINLLANLTYDDIIMPFADYKHVSRIPCRKFLVTTGFTAMQNSKIKQLGIKDDFEAIFVIDPMQSDFTKSDIFSKILTNYNLSTNEILVIGDDLNSEIKAARETGIESVLYDYQYKYSAIQNQQVITDFSELEKYLY